MKINSVLIMAFTCLLLAAFLSGLYIGRNSRGDEIQTATLNPSSTPVSAPTSRPASSQKKVNINTADIYTLMSLEGIGEIYARRIIEYREANGPFENIEDIKNVPGIGDKRFELIKDYITTGG